MRLTASDGYSAVRSYSIGSAPNALRRLKLSVEELGKGEVSPYLKRELNVGDELELRGPIGDWFVCAPSKKAPIQTHCRGFRHRSRMSMLRSRTSAGQHFIRLASVFSLTCAAWDTYDSRLEVVVGGSTCRSCVTGSTRRSRLSASLSRSTAFEMARRTT